MKSKSCVCLNEESVGNFNGHSKIIFSPENSDKDRQNVKSLVRNDGIQKVDHDGSSNWTQSRWRPPVGNYKASESWNELWEEELEG